MIAAKQMLAKLVVESANLVGLGGGHDGISFCWGYVAMAVLLFTIGRTPGATGASREFEEPRQWLFSR
jgi:hypothetical protein